MFAINKLSQFMQNPLMVHISTTQRVLRYMHKTIGKGLMFIKNDHLNIEGNSYIDWAGDMTDKRSTSRFYCFVGGNLVSWKSKK